MVAPVYSTRITALTALQPVSIRFENFFFVLFIIANEFTPSIKSLCHMR